MPDQPVTDLAISYHALNSRSRRWSRVALIASIWTIIGVVFTLQSYFTSFRTERPVSLVDAAYLQMTWAYLWALATPLVLWVANRLPIDRRNWPRIALLHLPISLVLSVIVTAVGHVLAWLYWGWSMGRSFSLERMGRFILANFSEGIGIYLLIALASHAYRYYCRYLQGQSRTLELEAQLSRAELQALKMQLHPHFLFNTLHSISALMPHDPDAARTMITRLGDFLRITLESSGIQEVTLKQEIEFLRCYLEIEQIRFQDRLETRVDVASDALDAKVPNLILQPIVENAIRHGIASHFNRGLIEITGRTQNGSLRIQVRDNGGGLIGHRNGENLFQSGIGLANTEARLDRLYGRRHRLDLTNDPLGGSVVTLEIPLTVDNDGPPASVD
jgi:sensor histidine kinase YesM